MLATQYFLGLFLQLLTYHIVIGTTLLSPKLIFNNIFIMHQSKYAISLV